MKRWQSNIKKLVVGKWFYITPIDNETALFQQLYDNRNNDFFHEVENLIKDSVVICVNGYDIGKNGALLPKGILHLVTRPRIN